jgi:hypothetical protein
VLHYNGGVGHERPEVVRLHARVALEVFEEGGLVGVVIWVCRCPCQRTLAKISYEGYAVQDCFTQSSFWKRLRRRLRLRLPPSLRRRRLGPSSLPDPLLP